MGKKSMWEKCRSDTEGIPKMFLPLEKNDDLKNDYTVLHFIINSSIFMSEEVLDFSERGGRLLCGLCSSGITRKSWRK